MSKNEFDNEWLVGYMAKLRAERDPQSPLSEDIPDSGLESELQQKVLDYCKENGWPCWHDRSKKVNEPGWPDNFIFLPGMGEATAYKVAAHCLTPIEHEIETHKGQQVADKIVAQLRGKGKVALIELKSSAGKLRKEQYELRRVLGWNDHIVYIARSFKQVVEIIQRELKGD